ncbi:hypothetical protein ACTZWW_07670, partial [Salinarimonas sp. NSM]
RERPVAPARTDAEGFDIAALAARLGRVATADGSRRILVTARDAGGLPAALAERLGEMLGTGAPALLVEVATSSSPDVPAGAKPGFSDLVAGTASFFEAIDRLGAGRPHRVGAGTGVVDPLAPEEEEGLEIALAAFDETYGATLLVLPDAHAPGALAAMAQRADAVVIAARTGPEDERLVSLYEAAKEAGAPEVVVALAPAGDEITRAA